MIFFKFLVMYSGGGRLAAVIESELIEASEGIITVGR